MLCLSRKGTGSGTDSNSVPMSTVTSWPGPSPSLTLGDRTETVQSTTIDELHGMPSATPTRIGCFSTSDSASIHFSVTELVVAILVTAFGAGLLTGLIVLLATNRYWKEKKKHQSLPIRRTYSYSPNRTSYISSCGRPLSTDVASTEFVVNCKDMPLVVRPAALSVRFSENTRHSSEESLADGEHLRTDEPGIYDSVVSGFEFDQTD